MLRYCAMSIGLGAFVVVLLSPVLRADIVVYSVTENNGGGGYPSGSSGTFTVPQYTDPGGKPLLKVTLAVTGHSVGGSQVYENRSGPFGSVAGTATVSIGTYMSISGPLPAGGSQLIVGTSAVNSSTGPVAADDGMWDWAGPDSISVTGTGATDTQSSFKTAAADLVPYSGAGTVSFGFLTSTSAGMVSDTGAGARSVEGGTIRSDYTATVTYEALPEPGCLLLLSAGALVALRRRV